MSRKCIQKRLHGWPHFRGAASLSASCQQEHGWNAGSAFPWRHNKPLLSKCRIWGLQPPARNMAQRNIRERGSLAPGRLGSLPQKGPPHLHSRDASCPPSILFPLRVSVPKHPWATESSLPGLFGKWESLFCSLVYFEYKFLHKL